MCHWQGKGIVCVCRGCGGADNHHVAALHTINSPEAFSEETVMACNRSLNLIL